MTIKDSGTRRQFDSGAVRDMQEGKGRCDLLPACAILRIARHFEAGAKKYDDRNWEKGIPVGSFIDSAIRHLMKYLDGQVDEDHLCAAGWNILCAMWTEEKRPDLINIPTRPEVKSEGLRDMPEIDEMAALANGATKAYEAVTKQIRKLRDEKAVEYLAEANLLPREVEITAADLERIIALSKEPEPRKVIVGGYELTVVDGATTHFEKLKED